MTAHLKGQIGLRDAQMRILDAERALHVGLRAVAEQDQRLMQELEDHNEARRAHLEVMRADIALMRIDLQATQLTAELTAFRSALHQAETGIIAPSSQGIVMN